jgi:hypothetical protein
MRVVYPRWIRLRANSISLSGRHTTASNTFNQVSTYLKNIKPAIHAYRTLL